MDNTFNELWVDIKGYENEYKISTLGRIISLKWGMKKLLKATYRVDGYLQICLYKNKKSELILIHRLMCMSFLENNELKPYINHINGNKSDNRIVNLEWCTGKENYEHAVINGLVTKGKNKRSTPINQLSITGLLLKRWSKMSDIKSEHGYNCQLILPCCNGTRNSAYGFKWQYDNNK